MLEVGKGICTFSAVLSGSLNSLSAAGGKLQEKLQRSRRNVPEEASAFASKLSGRKLLRKHRHSPDFYDGYYKFKEIWRQEGSEGTSACGAMQYLRISAWIAMQSSRNITGAMPARNKRTKQC
ncbi:hypothetical protein BBD41_08580 [Paenibacillus ihbetae]|uniref:Uncharacterized protein n=1 Tax=Paenibacillus ihbetae TaxID=1870820 RepID=A0A1B2DY39_9BACL|nr:hypothetical protein BBD41_08580 [Paenibacillus ihbetae]